MTLPISWENQADKELTVSLSAALETSLTLSLCMREREKRLHERINSLISFEFHPGQQKHH